ncbi:MAG: Aldo/keto reductase [Candidatus Uhrbacteria bacterium GW2011_GWF2_39_13]|uniref:Aldo/keto reductase n=1 Tax=Candidatus Uhrbacteria bacterium GW2011_GWF2_39_13 TaxID=1618995 RepID=A0A0G0MHC9_9BACT|nr:MAG: Aldo/keto reductase [Candidatus Uhrbacteria bacterium GW2011_GWF2_39_13]
MLYRKMKNGDVISILGYGAMRLPQLKNGEIDEIKAEKHIRYAISKGVNYIDTAKIYHGGKCEAFLGKILSRDGLRNKVNIATKLPPWQVKEKSDMMRIFNEQLKDLQTGYIDYYLVHALDGKSWKKMKDLGVLPMLDKLLREGKIKNAGFSFHGNIEHFYQIVDDYDWTFCQIQFNFLDTEYQAGLKGLKYAAEKGLSIIVMEPLRGGRLAQNPPDEVKDIYSASGLERTPAWVWNFPEVVTVLSGMSTYEQVRQNVKTASDSKPGSMAKKELEVISKVTKVYKKLTKIGCTGCMYCLPCPVNVAIPSCFEYYNGFHLYKDDKFKTFYKNFLGDKAKASLCVNCGQCVEKCPQSLPIPELLKKVVKEFE